MLAMAANRHEGTGAVQGTAQTPAVTPGPSRSAQVSTEHGGAAPKASEGTLARLEEVSLGNMDINQIISQIMH